MPVLEFSADSLCLLCPTLECFFKFGFAGNTLLLICNMLPEYRRNPTWPSSYLVHPELALNKLFQVLRRLVSHVG